MSKPFYSIVIPTYNEEVLLPQMIESVFNQTYRDFEVIVADNHSTDKTRKILSKYNARVVEGNDRPGIARNKGASIANGEFLVFLDADTTIGKDFLKDLLIEINKRNFVAASGFFVGDQGTTFDLITHSFLNNYFWLLQKINPHAYGCFFAIRNDIFRKLDGFDPDIIMAEDHELAYRISKLGKFSFLRKPTITVSVRRIGREGRLSAIGKGIYVEAYRIFNKKITKKLFEYEMGGGIEETPK